MTASNLSKPRLRLGPSDLARWGLPLLLMSALFSNSISAAPLQPSPATRSAVGVDAGEPALRVASPARLRLGIAWLAARLDHELVPGAGLALTAPGRQSLVIGLGRADLANDVRAGADTPFRAGSISKLFTALAIVSMVEKGSLSLDLEVESLLDFIPSTPEHEAPMTVRQLLSHTSGLREEASLPYFIEFNFPTAEVLRSDAASFENRAPSGAQYRYSNLGYGLLGMVAEAVSIRPFSEIVAEEVLRPLGLGSTSLDATSSSAPPNGYAIRSASNVRTPFAPYSFEALAPAGGLITTAADLAQLTEWMGATLAAPDLQMRGPVSRRSLLKMAERPAPNGPGRRGLGINFYSSPRGVDFVGHGGYCAGYRAIVYVEPTTGNAISLLLNVNDVSPNQLAGSLYDLVFEREVPQRPAAAPARLERYEGIYDRQGMPERYAIATNGDALEVLPLFSERPVEDLTHLRPDDDGSLRKDDGSLVRFDRAAPDAPLRFWIEEFHYLTRIDSLPSLPGSSEDAR